MSKRARSPASEKKMESEAKRPAAAAAEDDSPSKRKTGAPVAMLTAEARQNATGGGEPDPSDVVAGVYDPDTGALTREFDSYKPPQKPRGYGLTADLDDHPLLRPHISLVVAPTGGGKTTLKLNLLEEILDTINPERLGKVYFYTGSPQDDLLRHLNPEVVTLYGPENTESFLSDMRKLQLSTLGETSEEKKPLNILILDDATNNQDLTPANTKGTDMGQIFMQHRHLGLVIIASGQRWMMIPKFLRTNMTHLFLFPGKAKSELKEVFKTIDLPQDQLMKTMGTLTGEQHQFMWLDLKNRTAKIDFNQVVLR